MTPACVFLYSLGHLRRSRSKMESRYLPLMVLLLCVRLAASQEVVHSFSGTSERLLGVQVSSSGELLVRSNESVRVIDPSGGGGSVVSTQSGAAVVFQQSDILSSSAALRCAGRACGLYPLNNLGQAFWSSVDLSQSVTGLSRSIITRFSSTTISLNTAEVVDGRYLDARRYDFKFVSTTFTSAPTSVQYRTTETDQIICSGDYIPRHTLRYTMHAHRNQTAYEERKRKYISCIIFMFVSAYW